MNAIIDRRTGVEVTRFADYVAAAVYRRDVLRPRSALWPYEIRGVPA